MGDFDLVFSAGRALADAHQAFSLESLEDALHTVGCLVVERQLGACDAATPKLAILTRLHQLNEETLRRILLVRRKARVHTVGDVRERPQGTGLASWILDQAVVRGERHAIARAALPQ